MNLRKRFNPEKGAVFLVLSMALLLLLPGCGREAVVALQDPVRKISRVETNSEALQAWVITDAKADVLIHIDTSDDMRVFSASYTETMKNAADHLKRKNILVVDQIKTVIEKGGTVNLGQRSGLYKRVIWVLPATASVGSNMAESFKRVLYKKRNYSKTDLADLKSDGKYITGTIDRIPITVTNMEDLEIGEEETAILDIDLGFFMGQKVQDKGQRMGTRVLFDFLRMLKRKNIRTSQVTINLSSVSGTVPMDMRFFGDVIEDILTHPETLEGPIPEKYSMMMEAEEALISGRYDRAEALYGHLTERYPAAGLFFSLAVARGFQDKGETCLQALLKAYDLDTAYLKGFFQFARVLGVNGNVDAGEKILNSSEIKALVPEGELDYQKGLFFFSAGLNRDAILYLELVAQKKPKDFALRTVMYKAYKNINDVPKMTATLEKLIKMDENRVIRDMPWVYLELGQLCEEFGVYQRARETYEKYLDYVPNASNAVELRKKINQWKDYR